jgi:hypothetical protein
MANPNDPKATRGGAALQKLREIENVFWILHEVLLECGGAPPLRIARENQDLVFYLGIWDLELTASAVSWDLGLVLFGSVHGRK